MIRFFDVIFSLSGLIIGLPVMIILAVIGYFDTGSPIFRQQRLGKNQRLFTLFKYRTMRVDTPSVATHLVQRSTVTAFGGFLRKSKLDELPQLVNVLLGDMSLVGPRPNLDNQDELIEERQHRGVYEVLPGITGLAQLNGIDMSTPRLLAETDARMIESLRLQDYFKYLAMTIMGKGSGDRIKD